METQLTTLLKEPRVTVRKLPASGGIPNNLELALIVYEGALEVPEPGGPEFIENLLRSHRWVDSWRNGVYDYHHYHSTAHEVLVVYRGSARVQFGGDGGFIQELRTGDAVIIPAGVGHKNVGSSPDFSVVGAYPVGQSPDLKRGEPAEFESAVAAIRKVPVPPGDPLFGPTGPLLDHWKVNA